MGMYKSCARCGKIHSTSFVCGTRTYQGGNERKLRSKWSWTKKSEEIREKANYLCEVCRDKGQITYDSLEVHHIVKLSSDNDGLLDNYNLICLCVEHHKQADKGKLSVEYLRNLARQREDNSTEKKSLPMFRGA